MSLHVFRNVDGMYWTGDRWGTLDDAVFYEEDDVETLAIPVSAEMLTLWEVNEIQFARFIAEIQMAGGLTPDVMQALGLSMDLNSNELDDLIERAVTFWDKIKAKT